MIPVQQYVASGDLAVPVVYELVPRQASLPEVDFSKSVKRVLFSDATVSKLIRFETRSSFLVGLVFNVSQVLMLPAVCNVGGVGESLAVILAILHAPGMLVTIGNMRIEMARLLIRRFDWWYFSIANTLYIICFVLYLRDLRAIIAPNIWIMHEVAILADAQVATLSAVALSTLLSGFAQIVLGIAIVLNWIPSPDITIATYSARHYKLSVRDLLINSIAHIVVLVSRMGYNKWVHVKERRRVLNEARTRELTLTTVRCSIYRCFVQLRSVSTRRRQSSFTQVLPGQQYSPSLRSRRRSDPGIAAFVPGSTLTPLRYTKVDTPFMADDLVIPLAWKFIVGPQSLNISSTLSQSLLVVFYSVGAVGFAITISCFTKTPKSLGDSKLVLAGTGALATLSFCLGFVALHQRQLLRRLWRSFDYVYLQLQVVFALASACDLLFWDPEHCLPVVSLGIWAHWVLTLDALPPCARQALRFSEIFELPILVTGFIAQLVLLFDLFKWRLWAVPDRILFQAKIAGVDVILRVMPFLLTRLIAIFIWNCRLLWRVSRLAYARQMHSESEGNRLKSHLVILTGNVEYDYQRRLRRKSLTQRGIRVESSRQIVATTPNKSDLLGNSSPR